MPEMDFLELADEVRSDDSIIRLRKVGFGGDRTSGTNGRGRMTKDVMGRKGLTLEHINGHS